MKKMLSIMLAGVLMLAVSGCGAEPQHKVSYVSGEKLTVLEQYDCVAVYTQYTNDSSETAVPADEVTVKAFQNGVELSPLVPTERRYREWTCQYRAAWKLSVSPAYRQSNLALPVRQGA